MIRLNSLDRENRDYLKINVDFKIVKAGTSLQNIWDVSTDWKRRCTVNVSTYQDDFTTLYLPVDHLMQSCLTKSRKAL